MFMNTKVPATLSDRFKQFSTAELKAWTSYVRRSSKNSDAGSTLVIIKCSRARVQAT